MLLAGLLSFGLAQPLNARREAGILYLSLNDLATALGYSLSESDVSLTLRAPSGILTVFADSSEVLWSRPGQAERERSLSAPVLRRGGDWFAPEELLATLGLALEGERLLAPDGHSFALDVAPNPQQAASTEILELGSNVTALAFYASGVAGSETVSLLILDAGLLALAFPEQQRALDAQLGRFEDANPLYFVVTALAEASWQPQFVLEQGTTRLELAYPFAVSLLSGEPERVSPDAPAVGIVLVPPTVNLRAPLNITWQSLSAVVQFRR